MAVHEQVLNEAITTVLASQLTAPRRTVASYLFRTGRAIIKWVTQRGGPHKFLNNAKQLLLNVLRLDESPESMLRGKTSLVLVRCRHAPCHECLRAGRRRLSSLSSSTWWRRRMLA